ncbi:TPA: hypothetical protein EYP75_06335 [Candidatus Bathyarchaeota archaeon]|nr:hypothetical protein [Candidatus Bathyarchaeota archaeon]
MESAARAVAAELGLEITGVSLMKGTSICNLVSGLGDVTIVGRVLHVNPPHSFIRSDGEEGKMRSLYIADETGIMRVVIWGEKADLLGSSEMIGKIIRFSHGYVRKGYNGKLELNIGLKGNIEVSPPEIPEDEFPSINIFYKKINQITKSETRVNTFGLIVSIFPVNTFTREGNVSGKVRRLEIRDQTGRITVVLWNNKVDELADLEIGKYLEIFGAKVRKDLNGHLELHVNGSVDIAVLPNPPSDLKEDLML